MLRMLIISFLLAMFMARACHGYVLGVNDEYYERVVKPKLDILRDKVMSQATEMITGRKPDYEVELSAEERYFPSDDIEFLTGKVVAQYSGIKKLATWRQGLTLITGWTFDGIKYYVNYVYTRDMRFEPLAGIHVLGGVSALESYFGGSLYDISAESGSVCHVQAVWANCDWSATCVLVKYTGEIVKSIEAWDDNVNDIVPIVPRTERMDKYIQDNKTRINRDAEYSIALVQREMRQQKGFLLSPEVEEHSTNWGVWVTGIAILSLASGVVLSLFLVVVYKKLGTRSPTRVLVNTNVPSQVNTNSPSKEEDYIDVEYVEVSKLKDTE